MTTTFHCHISTKYTVGFCLQKDEGNLIAQSVTYLGADNGHHE